MVFVKMIDVDVGLTIRELRVMRIIMIYHDGVCKIVSYREHISETARWVMTIGLRIYAIFVVKTF